MNDKLKQIIKHYGTTHQLKHFQEEAYELTEAILWDYLTPNTWHDKYHIAEEIADCLVMIKQFQLYYGIHEEDIMEIMEYKINRQIERIEKECKHQNND